MKYIMKEFIVVITEPEIKINFETLLNQKISHLFVSLSQQLINPNLICEYPSFGHIRFFYNLRINHGKIFQCSIYTLLPRRILGINFPFHSSIFIERIPVNPNPLYVIFIKSK